ncbi:DUF881 domain-containing protein [Phytoactinopolyspora limicola]|uniref:DUF881 domain-containing protein n=1 Tax=Phytoactinopolyspora limicola TaxID=2715536 RepID=UPI00140C7770|nr:DUF881 domain-containing protein [Phytoactinopolyspora limicola]
MTDQDKNQQPPDDAADQVPDGAAEKTPDTSPEPGPAAKKPAPPRFTPVAPSGAKRFWRALTKRPHAGHVGVGLLVGILGFAAVVQVRGDEEDVLAHARRDELMQIYDGLRRQGDRLEEEITELRRGRDELISSADAESVAMTQAEERLRQTQIMAGTAPATGPGIQMTVSDPDTNVRSVELFGAVQELRSAGAEAIQIEGVGSDTSVRVVADTHFLDADGGVRVSGRTLEPTYVVTAIGNPVNLEEAMYFPQGVVSKLEQKDAEVTITQFSELTVDTLHEVQEPQHARPAPEED